MHLLLAFPLFVVVVAVDARWVTRSFAQRFPGLLTAPKDANDSYSITLAQSSPSALEGHATPNDYLEKIFQIPFWLKRPEEKDARNMLMPLLGGTSGAVGGQALHGAAQATNSDAAANPLFRRRPHDPNARTLDITPAEHAFIDRLVPLLDRSPRALKRFVNVYRLLKASLTPAEEDCFLDSEPGATTHYMTVLLLLAIVNGLPNLGDAIMASLRPVDVVAPEGTKPAANEAFEAWVKKLSVVPASIGDDERQRLNAWLKCEHGKALAGIDTASVLSSLPRVARFSYHCHQGAVA